MRLQGKRVLITGTAGGQGAAAQAMFAKEGARIIGCDIHEGAAESAAAALREQGHDVRGYTLDLTDAEAAKHWIDEAAEVLGGIDVLYNNALRDYNGGNNDLATQEFNDYIKFYPNTDLAGNAYFYLAEVQFKAGDYQKAVANYDLVVQNFPSGNKAAAAQLKKGFALLELGKEDEGIQELKHVIQRYPRTNEATQARERLRKLAPAPRSR